MGKQLAEAPVHVLIGSAIIALCRVCRYSDIYSIYYILLGFRVTIANHHRRGKRAIKMFVPSFVSILMIMDDVSKQACP